MGYYTHYSLEVTLDEADIVTREATILEMLKNAQSDTERLSLIRDAAKIRGITQEDIIADLQDTCDEAKYALDKDGNSVQEAKWYYWEKDMREFSKKYPSALFTLSGEGGETGDIWKAYFINGKAQIAKARIVIDEFDPKKLA